MKLSGIGLQRLQDASLRYGCVMQTSNLLAFALLGLVLVEMLSSLSK